MVPCRFSANQMLKETKKRELPQYVYLIPDIGVFERLQDITGVSE